MEWISVKEKLPEDNKKVIIVDYGKVSVGSYGHGKNNNDWWDDLNVDQDGCSTDCCEVTHWMPLPEPPKKEDGKRSYIEDEMENDE